MLGDIASLQKGTSRIRIAMLRAAIDIPVLLASLIMAEDLSNSPGKSSLSHIVCAFIILYIILEILLEKI